MGADTDGNTAQNLFRKLGETSEKLILFVNFIFRECTAALIPIAGSKNHLKSSRFDAFTIGNPIENLGFSGNSENQKNPKF